MSVPPNPCSCEITADSTAPPATKTFSQSELSKKGLVGFCTKAVKHPLGDLVPILTELFFGNNASIVCQFCEVELLTVQ